MNFNFDLNSNYFDHPKRPKLTKEEKWILTFIVNTILFIVLCFICYKYHNDVMYKMQIQIAWISKKYVWFNSRGFCIFLFILFIFCIYLMKLWFSVICLIFYISIIPCFFWMKKKYLYTDALLNGIIWYKELFNYNVNIYLYKALEVWQVQWVVNKELEMRPNVVSFWIYWECRYFWHDPYIMHFFDDFVFDWNDCENYERIRNQIDKYQFAKIALKKSQNVSDQYQYLAENKAKVLLSESVDFFINYGLAFVLGSIIFALIISLIYFHFFENPFWYRVFPEWFPRPVPVTPEVVAEQVEPYIPTLTDIMIRQFGKIPATVDVQTLTRNLKYVVSQNYELIKEASKMPLNPGVDTVANLPPEVISKAFQTLYPSILANQNTCVEILNKLDEMNNSPFEQFEVNVLQRISFFGLDFSFSNLTLYLVLAMVVIVVISSVINRSVSLVPNNWQSVIEIFYSFIFNMLIDQSGKKAKVFFPAIYSLFFFILVSNLLGLIPLSFAVTSHVVITFCLGFGFFVAWIIVAFKVIGLKIFNIFWPTNVPLWLRPLLMVVEILSFSLRPLSLSIRLFVNILAGHILLHLVAGSVVLVFSKAAIFSFIPFVLLLAVFCLELGIAFLQAYIFSILLCIYLHDSYHVHGH